MNEQADPANLALLERLLSATDPMTPQALGRAMGLSAVAVARRLEALRRAGCRFDEHPQRGIVLVEAGLGCWSDYLEARHGGRLGRRVIVYRSTTSTQDRARQRIRQAPTPGDLHGTAVLADVQTAGRGRLGRRWLAEPGEALLMTVILKAGPLSRDRLLLASACAVAETVEQVIDRPTQLRWPNDVLLDGAKLAGILLERVGGCDLVGIGVNVYGRPTLDDQATACLAQTGRTIDRLVLADRLMDRLDGALFHDDEARLHASWRQRSALLQSRVTVRAAGTSLTGRVIDVDVEHGLLLAVEHGPPVVLPAATTELVAVH